MVHGSNGGPAAPAAGPGPFSRNLSCPALAALLLILATVVPSQPAAAGERPAASGFGRNVSGRLGLGMLSPEAPIAVRYLFDPRLGMELGAGIGHREARGTTVVLDGGLLLALAPGDRLNFYLRPGVRFRSVNASDEGATTTVSFTATLSFEVFMTRDFSVTAEQGLVMDFVSPPDGLDHTDFGTLGGPWTRLGFYYYLGAP